MELTNEQKKYILDWAQAKFDAMPIGEYGGDWWDAIIDDEIGLCHDINIWDDENWTLGTGVATVTAYPLSVDEAGELGANHSVFVRVGTIDQPVHFYVDSSCDICGDPMGGKYDGDIPTRYNNDEVAHLRCVYEMEKAL
jgi:hypothetical protein